MDINYIDNEIRSMSPILKSLGVFRIGIFGSYANSKNNPDSDLDILVEFKKGMKSFKNFISVHTLLNEHFRTKIDLITPESLQPFMLDKIKKDVRYVIF